MTLAWHGTARAEEVINLGPLALIQPLLDQLDIASIIDRHLPPDPQLEFSHGQVLSLLVAARLCQPTALINVPACTRPEPTSSGASPPTSSTMIAWAVLSTPFLTSAIPSSPALPPKLCNLPTCPWTGCILTPPT